MLTGMQNDLSLCASHCTDLDVCSLQHKKQEAAIDISKRLLPFNIDGHSIEGDKVAKLATNASVQKKALGNPIDTLGNANKAIEACVEHENSEVVNFGEFYKKLQGIAESGNLEQYNQHMSQNKANISKLDPVSPNTGIYPIIYKLICNNKDDILVSFLRDTGVNVNARYMVVQRSILHIAAINGRDKTISTIATLNGINLNEKDYDGNTPLQLAALNTAFDDSPTSGVKALLKIKGVNVNACNSIGQNALHLALIYYKKDPETIFMLIENGVKMNAKDIHQKTPLDYLSEEKTRLAKFEKDMINFIKCEIQCHVLLNPNVKEFVSKLSVDIQNVYEKAFQNDNKEPNTVAD